MICPNCGKDAGESNFCPTCGEKCYSIIIEMIYKTQRKKQ